MKVGIYIKEKAHNWDPRLSDLVERLRASNVSVYNIEVRNDVQSDTDVILSIGGDGTFLSASKRVADSGIPILGINFGRMGFLSESQPDEAIEAILKGQYSIEDRDMLYASIPDKDLNTDFGFWPFALNEITIHRVSASVMGINVSLDGVPLPTYWADGLIISTSSGSTAYSLSAGGPICTPESRVIMIVPISPHNLNVRPLVVPNTTKISISTMVRGESIMFTMDNRTMELNADTTINISLAGMTLRRVKLPSSNFVNALTSKLYWGEDIRNS